MRPRAIANLYMATTGIKGEIRFWSQNGLGFPCPARPHNPNSLTLTHSTKGLMLHYLTNPKIMFMGSNIIFSFISPYLRYRMSINWIKLLTTTSINFYYPWSSTQPYYHVWIKSNLQGLHDNPYELTRGHHQPEMYRDMDSFYNQHHTIHTLPSPNP